MPNVDFREVGWSYSRSQTHQIQQAVGSFPSLSESRWAVPRRHDAVDPQDLEDEDYFEEAGAGDNFEVGNDGEPRYTDDDRCSQAAFREETDFSTGNTRYFSERLVQRDLRRLAQDAIDETNRARSRSPKWIGVSGEALDGRGRGFGRRQWPNCIGAAYGETRGDPDTQSASRQRRGSHHERYDLWGSSRDYSDEEDNKGRCCWRSSSRSADCPGHLHSRQYSSSYEPDASSTLRRSISNQTSAAADESTVSERTALLKQGHSRSQSSSASKVFSKYGGAERATRPTANALNWSLPRCHPEDTSKLPPDSASPDTLTARANRQGGKGQRGHWLHRWVSSFCCLGPCSRLKDD